MNTCDYLPDDIESKVDELTNHIKVRDEYAEAIAKAERKAKVALKTSRCAAQEKTGIFNTEAVCHLQQACIDMSNALISLTESQKKAFENQKKLVAIINYLFSISIHNMASYRKVINDLSGKITMLSDSPEDERVKNELKEIIQQLKSHEDILKKLESHDHKLKELEERINQSYNRL